MDIKLQDIKDTLGLAPSASHDDIIATITAIRHDIHSMRGNALASMDLRTRLSSELCGDRNSLDEDAIVGIVESMNSHCKDSLRELSSISALTPAFPFDVATRDVITRHCADSMDRLSHIALERARLAMSNA